MVSVGDLGGGEVVSVGDLGGGEVVSVGDLGGGAPGRGCGIRRRARDGDMDKILLHLAFSPQCGAS